MPGPRRKVSPLLGAAFATDKKKPQTVCFCLTDCWPGLTNLKKEEDIPELTEERVTQWMRLCVGALQDWLNSLQAAERVIQPPNHADHNPAGARAAALGDYVLAYRVWKVLYKSHSV